MTSVEGYILNAYVDEHNSGIYMRIVSNNGKQVVVHSSTEEPWLTLKEGMNAQEELQKVCDLLNGYKMIGEEKISFDGVYPKKVTITNQNQVEF